MLASKNAAEPGGLSGKPLFALALDTIGRPRKRIGDGAALIAVGGIDRAPDALAMFSAGADLVQAYSALVRESPARVRRLTA